MNLSDLRQTFEDVKRHPLSAIVLLLLLALVAVVIAYYSGYLQEKGRQSAARDGGVLQPSGSAPSASQGSQATPEESPVGFRVMYYRFEGSHALSRLLAGYAFSDTETFHLRPFIMKNAVYDDLQGLLALFPWHATSPFPLLDLVALEPDQTPAYRDTVEERPSSARLNSEERRQNNLHEILSATPVALRPQSGASPTVLEHLKALLSSDPNWTVVAPSDLMDRPHEAVLDSIEFFGLPEGRELLEYIKDPVTREIAERYPTKRDLALVHIYFTHGGYSAVTLVRELSLLALDIENVDEAPLKIDSIHLSETGSSDLFELATPKDKDALLSSADQPTTKTIPLTALLPGEHLLIPLGLELGVSSGPLGIQDPELVIHETGLPARPDWWRSSGASSFSIPLALKWLPDNTIATEEVLLPVSALRAKKDIRENFHTTYSIGSRVFVHGISVGRGNGEIRRHEIRRFDPTDLMIRGGAQVGSCPILYVQSAEGWTRHGPILVDAVGRAKEATEHILLPPDVQRIRLVEEERERTYITCLKLTALVNAEEKVYREVGFCDASEQWLLEHGDSRELPVPYSPDEREALKLIVTGYYVPLQGNTLAGSDMPPTGYPLLQRPNHL